MITLSKGTSEAGIIFALGLFLGIFALLISNPTLSGLVFNGNLTAGYNTSDYQNIGLTPVAISSYSSKSSNVDVSNGTAQLQSGKSGNLSYNVSEYQRVTLFKRDTGGVNLLPDATFYYDGNQVQGGEGRWSAFSGKKTLDVTNVTDLRIKILDQDIEIYDIQAGQKPTTTGFVTRLSNVAFNLPSWLSVVLGGAILLFLAYLALKAVTLL